MKALLLRVHHLFESDGMSNMANPLEMKIKTQDQV
jgi:hypothetical protein